MNQLLSLQQKANEYLIVNPAALQIMLQMQLNAARLHQSLLKAANTCGCIKLGTAKMPALPDDADWQTLKSQPTGDDFSSLCPECREELADRLGSLLFYAAALCNTLGIQLGDVCEHEIEKLDLLGYFMLM